MNVRTRSARFTVALLAAAALSGCAGSSAPLEAESIEVVIPDVLATPGSSIAVGETVRVPGLARTDDGTLSGHTPAELGLTVTDVSWPGEALLNKFDNADDFSDYEPVVVAYQVDSPAGEDRHDFMLGDLFGVLSDGEYAEELQGDFGIDTGGMDIGRQLDEACYRGEMPDPGTSELRCTVMLVPEGQTLDALEWNALDVDDSEPFAADDPRFGYMGEPLIFEISQP